MFFRMYARRVRLVDNAKRKQRIDVNVICFGQFDKFFRQNFNLLIAMDPQPKKNLNLLNYNAFRIHW